MFLRRWAVVSRGFICLLLLVLLSAWVQADQPHRYLYVAAPGVRNYLEYGGHGLLVFDIENEHRFVRRIPTGGLGDDGQPLNVKGICGSAATGRIYISTLKHLLCLDVANEKVLWERQYEGGCDRMAITPDGQTIYLPTLEQDHWKVIRAEDGTELTRIVTNSGTHNTVMAPDGKHVYLAGLRSPLLTVADTTSHQIVKQVGPFSDSIRPFTVDGNRSLCFVNVNGLLGFEIGDLKTGKMLHRVVVEGYEQGPVKRHGCPSHGIGVTPDGHQLWVADAANSSMHVYDVSRLPPTKIASISVRDQPGWVTFSRDGSLAYPSTGDVIDTKTRQVIAQLTDEEGRAVGSEKMLEVVWEGDRVTFIGDQFGRAGAHP
jgi:hypothetical protein